MKLYPMKRMLVCTDLSAESDLVLMAAEELRKKNDGTIDLLYVSELGFHFENVVTEGLKISYRDIFLGDIKKSIESKINGQMDRCGVKANFFICDGKVDEVIFEMTEKGHHDLIVMGHGRKPLIQKILGSNALKMVSKTPIPLLVTKIPQRFQRIAGLVDESRPMDRIIIGTLDFFRNFSCESVEFISVWLDYPEPFGDASRGHQLESILKGEVQYFSNPDEKPLVKVEPTKELKLAHPIERILVEDKIDLVVLKKFSQGNLKRVYIGSTTKNLLDMFEGNILVLPP